MPKAQAGRHATYIHNRCEANTALPAHGISSSSIHSRHVTATYGRGTMFRRSVGTMHIIYRKAQPTLSNSPCRRVSNGVEATSLLDVFLPLMIHLASKPGMSVARTCGNDVGRSPEDSMASHSPSRRLTSHRHIEGTDHQDLQAQIHCPLENE